MAEFPVDVQTTTKDRIGMKSKSPLKAKPLRNPGQSLDEQIQELINDKLVSYLIFPAFFWLVAFLEWLAQERGLERMPGTYALAASVFTAVVAIKFFQLRRQIRQLKQGRDGEIAVGQYLERLRRMGAHVFHDVLADDFNLDHVVVCSHGIFTIETKTHSKPSGDAHVTFSDGKLLVGGFTPDRDPLIQAKAGASWLSRLLKESTGKDFKARGVILFPGWFVDPVPQDIKRDVWVLEPKALASWIEREPSSLSESDVALVAYHLSRYIRTK